MSEPVKSGSLSYSLKDLERGCSPTWLRQGKATEASCQHHAICADAGSPNTVAVSLFFNVISSFSSHESSILATIEQDDYRRERERESGIVGQLVGDQHPTAPSHRPWWPKQNTILAIKGHPHSLKFIE